MIILYAIEELRHSLNIKEKNGKKALKHTINKKTAFFPFQTRNPERAKFKEGFASITGEFFRNLNGEILTKDLDKEKIIDDICNQVQFNYDSDREDFKRLLESFLYKNHAIKLFHPMMYKYIPLSESKESLGEKEIAKYLYDAFMTKEINSLSSIEELTEKEHVLINLIQRNMPRLETKEHPTKYSPALPFIRDLFKEDVETLLTNRDFFMKNINIFLAYYYFYSTTQLSIKINQFGFMDSSSPKPVYYNLDWETSNRNRPAVTTGYKFIFDTSRKILAHVNVQEHLNFLMETENMTYNDLHDKFSSMIEYEKLRILRGIHAWTLEYSEIVLGTSDGIEYKDSWEEATRQLYRQISSGLSKETKYRFALAIHEIGKQYFLKTRGSLGNTLNVTQDFLILLTALSVKHERISVKQLFIEFERRGVFFDRYSREKIIELFNKLNLIEKKSDSGDAQYVKPIL